MNCLVKQFTICLGVVVILLLNVMGVFSVGGGSLLDRLSIVFQIMYVLCLWSQCVSRCSFHRFCLCLYMSEVISSQVFAVLMLFLCVIFHSMRSRESLQFVCILPFGILCLSDF